MKDFVEPFKQRPNLAFNSILRHSPHPHSPFYILELYRQPFSFWNHGTVSGQRKNVFFSQPIEDAHLAQLVQ